MKNVLSIIIIAVGLTGCRKEFLEVNPKGMLLAKTTSDYELLLYHSSSFTIAGSSMAQVAMGDEIAAVNPYYSGADLRLQRAFKWEDDLYNPDEDAVELSVTMKGLYIYNKIVEEVMESTGGTEAEKLQVMAQAKAARAWINFLLFNYYGKPYNPATAATDLGFPLILKADVTETNFTRATVQQGYDQIIADLNDAIPHLETSITHHLKWSKPAAQGTLGKVYLFMGKWNEALPLLTAAIGNLSSATIPIGLYDYNESLAPTTDLILLSNNKEGILARQFLSMVTFFTNEFAITSETAQLFAGSDLRLNTYTSSPYPSGVPFGGGVLRRRAPLAPQFGLLVSDLYLLTAECKARVDDLSGAIDDLEFFRAHRMPPANAVVPPAIAGDKKALVKFILEERIREFAVLGYRWFDMRRLSVDPDYSSTIGYTHKLYDESGTVEQSYTLRPERLTLRLPLKIINYNPALPNNE